jgi:hypothetical protein
MAAIRVLLMLMMCLVTDAPGPLTAGVFEHLEDGEEVHLARRITQRRPASAVTAPQVAVASATARLTTPPPQPKAARAAQQPARKIPAPASAPPDSTEDH